MRNLICSCFCFFLIFVVRDFLMWKNFKLDGGWSARFLVFGVRALYELSDLIIMNFHSCISILASKWFDGLGIKCF